MANKPRNTKFKGLYKRFHYLYNRDFVDQDYHHKLDDETAEWLANFNDNYYGGRFKKDESKNPIKDHEERKRIWNAVYARRNDIFSYEKDRQIRPVDHKFLEILLEYVLLAEQLQTIDPNSPEYTAYTDVYNELSTKVLEEAARKKNQVDGMVGE